MIEKPVLKRYAITVQHEVIVYGYTPKRAQDTACKPYAKAKCIHFKKLPPVEVEALGTTVIDHRTAPGS